MKQLRLMSGGAAQGLVGALRESFEREHGCTLQGKFGAVGVMRDHLLAGEPSDLMILSQSLIDQLMKDGHLVSGSAQALGIVKTGVAVLPGAPRAALQTPEQLKSLLSTATAVYFPDPEKATAGIHFMKVLTGLGIVDEVRDRLRTFPNGATAMKAMADCHDPHEGNAVPGTGAALADMTETCTKCHTAQKGPFVFEHGAMREGCTVCHNPHGTVANNLLHQPTTFLCLRCHSGHRTMPGHPGGPPFNDAGVNPVMQRGFYSDCTQCHSQVHGSDLPGPHRARSLTR